MFVAYSNNQLDAQFDGSVNSERTRSADIYTPRSVVCVPTMGALHAGHATLVRAAARYAHEHKLQHVIVTIFVNPTQFNDPADFARYPKTIDADVQVCKDAGATGVFVPNVSDIYPGEHGSGLPRISEDSLPPAAKQPRLEDAVRPGHFAGVCQVVKRLFDLVKPTAAHFGEKDWQQLRVISQMVDMLRLPTSIVPVQTVREAGGLAMSSRNRFLSPQESVTALAISAALRACKQSSTPAEAEEVMLDLLVRHNITPQYAVVRNADTLLPFANPDRPANAPARALIAAKVGTVRLIDNDAF